MGILLYKYLSAENTKPIADRLRNNLSLAFKNWLSFMLLLAYILILSGVVTPYNTPYGEKHNDGLLAVFSTPDTLTRLSNENFISQ